MEPNDPAIIHVRFAPSAAVIEISERPPALSPQEWFNFLSYKAAAAYQALSGGRGVFRLTREEVDSLKAQSAPNAA